MNNTQTTFRRKVEQLTAFFQIVSGVDVHVDADVDGNLVVDGTPGDVRQAVDFILRAKPDATVERETWEDDPDWEIARIR